MVEGEGFQSSAVGIRRYSRIRRASAKSGEMNGRDEDESVFEKLRKRKRKKKGKGNEGQKKEKTKKKGKRGKKWGKEIHEEEKTDKHKLELKKSKDGGKRDYETQLAKAIAKNSRKLAKSFAALKRNRQHNNQRDNSLDHTPSASSCTSTVQSPPRRSPAANFGSTHEFPSSNIMRLTTTHGSNKADGRGEFASSQPTSRKVFKSRRFTSETETALQNETFGASRRSSVPTGSIFTSKYEHIKRKRKGLTNRKNDFDNQHSAINEKDISSSVDKPVSSKQCIDGIEGKGV